MNTFRTVLLGLMALGLVMLAVGYVASTDVVSAITLNTVSSLDVVVFLLLAAVLDRVVVSLRDTRGS